MKTWLEIKFELCALCQRRGSDSPDGGRCNRANSTIFGSGHFRGHFQESAFECAWLDHGSTLFGRQYDNVRPTILGEPRDGFVMALNKGSPDRTIQQNVVPSGRPVDLGIRSARPIRKFQIAAQSPD